MVDLLIRISTRAFAAGLVWLAAATPLSANSKAYIKLQLDGSEVFLGDTVVLEVESTGLPDPIDFSVIHQKATLLRETTGTRIAVIGGKVSEIKLRRMDLVPKTAGVLVLGPLTGGDVTSNSVHIKVLDAERPDWQPDPDDTQIVTSISPSSVRVNQQALLTVELLHRYPISNESVKLPSLDGFYSRTLISDRRTYEDESREYFRTEWQYLIYPRQSGTASLDAVQWSGTLAKSRVERADFSVNSEPLSIEVLPVPEESDGWWLPGGDVELSEVWSQPPTSLRAGDELERVITVTATNVLSGQIPALAVPESRAVQQTLINTSRTEQLTKDSVVSTATFTYRVKAQSPIPVFLDTVRIPWWNTMTNQAREAIIPARRINVGLPERADILSKLALQETGVSRLKHQLQTTSWIRLVVYSLALMSLAALCLVGIPALVSNWRRRSRTGKYFARLENTAASDNAEELYRLLKAPQTQKLLGGAERNLVQSLESYLFCADHTNLSSVLPADVTTQIEQIKQVVESRKLKPRNEHTLAQI